MAEKNSGSKDKV